VLTLIEAAGLVGPHFTFKAALRELLLEQFLQLCLACGIAASAGIPGRALVAADEDVFFEFGHWNLVVGHCKGLLGLQVVSDQ
jgi:hypothetical protein